MKMETEKCLPMKKKICCKYACLIVKIETASMLNYEMETEMCLTMQTKLLCQL